jgi:hypothetical protein
VKTFHEQKIFKIFAVFCSVLAEGDQIRNTDKSGIPNRNIVLNRLGDQTDVIIPPEFSHVHDHLGGNIHQQGSSFPVQ